MLAALALLPVADLDGGSRAATLLAGLAGACAGFLWYNLEPARIFMGDAGSMFLGLLLGALAMDNAYTRSSPVGALAPVMILGVPLFDMVFVMYIRQRRGLPVMMGSPDHVALRLRKWRLSTRQTVHASYAATVVLGGGGLLLSVLPAAGALLVVLLAFAAALAVAVALRRIDMSL
jgi:UDP-GlcNAc:undecaprenyl-phosphate GlcNAc-1-phosphate transferase